jgi:glycosidase
VAAPKGDESAVKAMVAYWNSAPPGMATFLSNHDIFAGPRAWDQFRGDEARYKLAASTYLLMPGTPFIYYGEEVGQAGLVVLQGDLPIRGPMSWDTRPHEWRATRASCGTGAAHFAAHAGPAIGTGLGPWAQALAPRLHGDSAAIAP